MQRSFRSRQYHCRSGHRPASFYGNRRNLSAAMRGGGLRLQFRSLRAIRQASGAERDKTGRSRMIAIRCRGASGHCATFGRRSRQRPRAATGERPVSAERSARWGCVVDASVIASALVVVEIDDRRLL